MELLHPEPVAQLQRRAAVRPVVSPSSAPHEGLRPQALRRAPGEPDFEFGASLGSFLPLAWHPFCSAAQGGTIHVPGLSDAVLQRRCCNLPCEGLDGDHLHQGDKLSV